MRTDDLIAVLAADNARPRPLTPRALAALAGPMLLAAGVVVAALGVRPDLGAALAAPVTLLKWALPLAVAGSALVAALRLARPTTTRLPEAVLLAGVLAAALLVWGTDWAATAPDARPMAVQGKSMAVCLASILAIALAPLLALTGALRAGASPRPTLSGALAGLATGGFAAAAYALHCDEDAPLFFVTWYGTAILACAAIGAWLGHRRLRW